LEIYGGSSLGAASMSGNNKMPQPKQNFHPTVKPTDLMLYLIRLVTPKGGTTLDPFMGSGSSGKAAVRGGFDFVGIEREKEYMEIAEARIQYEKDNPYNEETKTRINVKKEVNEKVNKFFNF
jgi:site-specific DNA-methyltransferase (adenine-specific)